MGVTSARQPLHDWILLGVNLDWKQGEVALSVSWRGEASSIVCSDIQMLRVPRAFPWGPSAFIYEVRGPGTASEGYERLVIQMQSGDEIEIIARRFSLPADQHPDADDPSRLPGGR